MISHMCDAIGQQMFEDFLNEVLDPLYFSEVSQEVHGKENWVFEEMWTYFKKKYQIHIIT